MPQAKERYDTELGMYLRILTPPDFYIFQVEYVLLFWKRFVCNNRFARLHLLAGLDRYSRLRRYEDLHAGPELDYSQALTRLYVIASLYAADNPARQDPGDLLDEDLIAPVLDTNQVVLINLRSLLSERLQEFAWYVAAQKYFSGHGSAIDVHIRKRHENSDSFRLPIHKQWFVNGVDDHNSTVRRGEIYRLFWQNLPVRVSEEIYNCYP